MDKYKYYMRDIINGLKDKPERLIDGGLDIVWYISLLAHLQKASSQSRELKNYLASTLADNTRFLTEKYDYTLPFVEQDIVNGASNLNEQGFLTFKLDKEGFEILLEIFEGIKLTCPVTSAEYIFGSPISTAASVVY